ncbi:Imm21 family immunity protein [Streptomyces sp. NPDC085937]|uniref:Imm21 family immunity protein n=1 Tax=Streptomyces sp. NPDC085937 TaxID=3365742 RepID=UPI0037D166B4
MGGPLIVVPVSALPAWHGCTQTGVMVGDATAVDDYDRACEVDDLAGVIAVGDMGAQALVLAEEPVRTRYVPELSLFVRWLAAHDEAELTAAVDAALTDPTTPWEEYGTWTTEGPAVLMDSAEAGSDLDQEYPDGGTPSYAPLPPRQAPGESERRTRRRRTEPGQAWSNSCPRTRTRRCHPTRRPRRQLRVLVPVNLPAVEHDGGRADSATAPGYARQARWTAASRRSRR